MIQEIFKGKGDPGIPAQYRDVLLADDDGKSLFKFIRTAIFPTVADFVFSKILRSFQVLNLNTNLR